ncbi:topless-related protein 1-like isoform X1 [Ananas comosus]|uniref:Topless-related protein 1-like isoform X1 n=1 Tax=Ananas comosus TaxID=4615 RepID=A0A6P5GCJ5_ANACO|nr:topless-related protein 1-like isoform X1 [Ananas comosus]
MHATGWRGKRRSSSTCPTSRGWCSPVRGTTRSGTSRDLPSSTRIDILRSSSNYTRLCSTSPLIGLIQRRRWRSSGTSGRWKRSIRKSLLKCAVSSRWIISGFVSENEFVVTQISPRISLSYHMGTIGREHERLKDLGDMNSMRQETCREIAKLIKANPVLKDKLKFPEMEPSSPRAMIDLNFPLPEPCASMELHGIDLNATHSPTQVVSIPPTQNSPTQVASIPPAQNSPTQVASIPPAQNSPTQVASILPAQNSPMQVASIPPAQHSPSLVANRWPARRTRHTRRTLRTLLTRRTQHSLDILPRTVIMTLIQGSLVSTMDFSPKYPTVLLVGTNTGEISVWDLTARERIHHRNCEIENASEAFQMALASDPTIAANRVRWDSNGILFGVAFSKNIVHLHNYIGRHELTKKSEIEAHVGGVNDIAFSRPHGTLYVITCGDDKTIKVWDAESTSLLQTFEGHSAPVGSVLPHSRRDRHFILSSSMDGRMKEWLYNVPNSGTDNAPVGKSFCTMAYNADGTRLFICGIRDDGLAYLEQWNGRKWNKVCSYVGFNNQCDGVPQFDIANSRFLAAGEEHMIKFWDMGHFDPLTTTDAEGGLPALPCVRFNKSGSLLAVSTNDNCFKVLANDDAQQLFVVGNQSNVVTAPYSEPKSKNGESPVTRDAVPEELNDGSRKRKPMEVRKPCQYYSLRLPDRVAKVERMVYTFSGNGILSLNSDGVHKLWKWQKTEANKSGQATATFPPLLWTPSSGMMMNNELGNANVGAAHCFALSKNDSYLVSSSGGNTSIFNMMSFKRMHKIMHSPSAVTFLACYPQDNNILAIGMRDSTIQIVNIRFDEVKAKLQGHQDKITGLVFSSKLNILVSSAADTLICVWGIDGWKKECSRSLEIPSGRLSSPGVETKIQLHNNQVHLLAITKTQLAVYDAATLELLKQWQPENGQITDGTYSCDGQMIYASLMDGVYTFTSDLDVGRRIRPEAYKNPQIPNVYPVVIAAHPSKPTQFVLGLSDGHVQVLERSESEKQQETLPPPESAAGGSTSSPRKGGGFASCSRQHLQ